ncbi:MAG: hypothetical protein AAGA30_12270 [Planctomycetota bacterium]
MSFAPKQNWDLYHSLVDPVQIEKDRSLSAWQKLRQYAEIFDSVWSLKTHENVNDEFMDLHEDEKLNIRSKQILAFRMLPGSDCD